MKLNLIPEAIRHRQERCHRIRGWAIVLMAATVVLAVPVALGWSRQAHAERLRREEAELETGRAGASAEWGTVRLEVEETHAQIERAEALRSKRAWSAMLALIADCVPPDAWLITISTDPAQPAGGSKNPRRALVEETDPEEPVKNVTIDAPLRLELQGYAPTAEDPNLLVRNLKASGVFKHVALQRSSRATVDDNSFFRFSVVCEW